MGKISQLEFDNFLEDQPTDLGIDAFSRSIKFEGGQHFGGSKKCGFKLNVKGAPKNCHYVNDLGFQKIKQISLGSLRH